MAHQDIGTDPFEATNISWDDVDDISDNFQWATAAVIVPTSG